MSKHIAIIGGTSGIGRATVAQLQSDGHTVHAACRSPEKLADLGIGAQPFDAAAPGPLVWPERLDGFVYFPGSISLKPFHRLTPEDFQRHQDPRAGAHNSEREGRPQGGRHGGFRASQGNYRPFGRPGTRRQGGPK